MELPSENVLANDVYLWAEFDVISALTLMYLPIWPIAHRDLLGGHRLHVQNHKQFASQKGVGVREKVTVMVRSHESLKLRPGFHLPHVMLPL